MTTEKDLFGNEPAPPKEKLTPAEKLALIQGVVRAMQALMDLSNFATVIGKPKWAEVLDSQAQTLGVWLSTHYKTESVSHDIDGKN